MAIEWSRTLSTGLDWQDEQHKQLLTHVDALIEAMQHRKGADEIGQLLEFLEKYVHFHFETEEKFMLENHDPMYTTHKLEHEQFKVRLTEFTKDFNQRGARTVTVMKMQSWLREWILDHIGRIDKTLGQHAAKSNKVHETMH